MPEPGILLPADKLEQLLLHYKYHTAVRRMARGVAHSYNNIFTGLGGQTAMLRQQVQLAGDSVDGDKRGDLIGDLLQRGIDQTAVLYSFARGDEDENCSRSPLLLANSAAELLNSISRIHRFSVTSEIHREKISCSLRDMVLVLFYLGENCVDATPSGGEITLTIRRATQPEPGIAFCFKDHGPGFSEEVAAAIGTPFVSTKTDTPYRGLGLYAARHLAARYGGRLTIDRDRQQTTLVGVVFPPVQEEQEVDTPADQEAVGRRNREEPPKQCFLVVEDDEALRTLLLNRLQRRGHMVFCVDTCAEAVEEYDNLHDIITTVLMDVGLRDGSGYECQQKLLKINPRARVIFMSGQNEIPPKESPEKWVFLQKPFTMDQLKKAVYDVHL